MKTTTLSDNDKDFIREYVAEAPTDAEKKARRLEVAESYGVGLPTIAAITAWTKIRADKAGAVETSPSETTIEPLDEVAIESDSSENDEEEPDEDGGEYFDYDNEIKRAWRKKMQEFIAENTDPAKRLKMRVLCLPGIQCHEIPIYLELGFNPNLIVGVEGGKAKARVEFEANAKKFHIQYRLGKLKDVVCEEKKPFDVVSLDFLGHFCRQYQQIFENILPAKETIVLINTHAGREDTRIQSYYDLAHNISAYRPHDQLMAKVDLKDSRETGNVSLFESIGTRRPEFPQRKFRTDIAGKLGLAPDSNAFIHKIGSTARYICDAVESVMKKEQLPPDIALHFGSTIGYFALVQLAGMRTISRYKKYRYKSPANNSPYNSDFGVVYAQDYLLAAAPKIAEFFQQFWQMWACKKGLFIGIRGKDEVVGKPAELVVLDEKKEVLAAIPLKKFTSESMLIMRILEKRRLGNEQTIYLEREEIKA